MRTFFALLLIAAIPGAFALCLIPWNARVSVSTDSESSTYWLGNEARNLSVTGADDVQISLAARVAWRSTH